MMPPAIVPDGLTNTAIPLTPLSRTAFAVIAPAYPPSKPAMPILLLVVLTPIRQLRVMMIFVAAAPLLKIIPPIQISVIVVTMIAIPLIRRSALHQPHKDWLRLRIFPSVNRGALIIRGKIIVPYLITTSPAVQPRRLAVLTKNRANVSQATALVVEILTVIVPIMIATFSILYYATITLLPRAVLRI
jgi:hypothetical protein